MSLCRTCLSENDLRPIFSDTNLCNQRTQELYNVTGVQIVHNDGYPQTMCGKCLRIVSESLKLRQISINSETILLKNKIQTKPEASSTFIIPISNIKCEEPLEGDAEIVNEISCQDMGAMIFKMDHVETRPGETVYIRSVGGNMLECGIKLENNDKSAIIQNTTKDIKKTKLDVKKKKKSNNVKFDIDIKEKVFVKKNGQKLLIKFRDGEDKLLALGVPPVDPGGVIQCAICNKSLQMASFRVHAKRHFEDDKKKVDKAMALAVTPYPPEGPIQCSVCSKVMQKKSFRLHAKTHLEREHVCEECGKRFLNAHNVSSHQQRVHGKEKRLPCDLCSYRAVDTLQLRNHIRAVHTGERPFICDICGEAFRMKQGVVQHMRVHFAVRNVQCDRCPSMFRSRGELAEHRNRSHLYHYAYYCYLCPKKFQRSYKTRKHIIKIHGVPRNQQNDKIEFDKTRRT